MTFMFEAQKGPFFPFNLTKKNSIGSNLRFSVLDSNNPVVNFIVNEICFHSSCIRSIECEKFWKRCFNTWFYIFKIDPEEQSKPLFQDPSERFVIFGHNFNFITAMKNQHIYGISLRYYFCIKICFENIGCSKELIGMNFRIMEFDRQFGKSFKKHHIFKWTVRHQLFHNLQQQVKDDIIVYMGHDEVDDGRKKMFFHIWIDLQGRVAFESINDESSSSFDLLVQEIGIGGHSSKSY